MTSQPTNDSLKPWRSFVTSFSVSQPTVYSGFPCGTTLIRSGDFGLSSLGLIHILSSGTSLIIKVRSPIHSEALVECMRWLSSAATVIENSSPQSRTLLVDRLKDSLGI